MNEVGDNDVFLWLGVAKRGLTATMLLKLAEYDSLSEAKSKLASLEGKVFLKKPEILNGEKIYFLHDVFYDLMDKFIFAENPKILIGRIKAIEGYLKQDAKKLDRSAAVLENIETTSKPIDLLTEELIEISKASASRRGDIIHYLLRLKTPQNQFRALRHIIRYSHDSYETKLDVALHNIVQEIDQHISITRNETDTSVRIIYQWLSILINTLLRTWEENFSNVQVAEELESRTQIFISDNFAEELISSPLVEELSQVWRANLLVNSSPQAARELIEEALSTSARISNDPETVTGWLNLYIKCFANRLLGYLNRVDSHFISAI